MKLLNYFKNRRNQRKFLKNYLENIDIQGTIKNVNFRSPLRFEEIHLIDLINKNKFIWLGLSSYSGYEREKFLDYCIANYKKTDFKWLLVRSMDWVDVIRSKASKFLLLTIHSQGIEDLIANFPTLCRLNESKNTDKEFTELKITINKLLISHFLTLPKNYKAYHSRYRKFIYLELIKIKEKTVLEIILKDPDCTNRSLLFEKLFNQYLITNMQKLSKDKCVKIRQNIYSLIFKSNNENSIHFLSEALFDKNINIRFSAKYYASKQYNINYREYYSLQETNEETLISLLYDTPEKTDLNLFKNGLTSKSTKTIELSLRALITLDEIKNFKPEITNIIFKNNTIFRLIKRNFYRVYSLSELLNMQSLFESKNRDFDFIDLVEVKSYFTSLKLALKRLTFQEEKRYIDFVKNKLLNKRNIYETIGFVERTDLLNLIAQIEKEKILEQKYIDELSFQIQSL